MVVEVLGNEIYLLLLHLSFNAKKGAKWGFEPGSAEPQENAPPVRSYCGCIKLRNLNII